MRLGAYARLLLVAALPALLARAAGAEPQLTVWARDFDAAGRIVELTLPPDATCTESLIAWTDAGGQAWGTRVMGRAGTHAYEMRRLPPFQGRIPALGTDTVVVRGGVEVPTWLDEADIFLGPECMLPSTVNLLRGHTLLAVRWEVWLSGLLAAVAVAAYPTVARRRAALALVTGFGIAWALLDVRASVDRAGVLRWVEHHRPAPPPLADVHRFADRAAELIGTATWSNEPLPSLPNSYLGYRLAEHPYVPLDARPPSTFVVTATPGTRDIVWSYGGYALVRR